MSATPAAATEANSVATATADAEAFVADLATRSREAQRALAPAKREVKDAALLSLAAALIEHQDAILEANAADVARSRSEGMKEGLIDRLILTPERIQAIADALAEIAALPDPVGQIVDGQVLPNGLQVRRQRVPLGVVGVIYEARPNVTVDVTALALKSGNAVLLRGGHAAEETNAAIIAALREGLRTAGLPEDLVATVDPAGRAGATALMRARGLVDVVVPRGGAGLIKAVVENSIVPVIETGAGNCHVYVDASADVSDAVNIIVNAKTQRVGVCNAAETLLIHRDIAPTYLPLAASALWERGVTLHADAAAREILATSPTQPAMEGEKASTGAGAASNKLIPATEEDWETEYGSLDLAVRIVNGVDEAADHIRRYSTGHTEAILSQDVRAINRFISQVDSAAIMVNASTRFTDGGQLGLGAELGISTQKLHARGPMGLEALTTTQWIVQGDGHIRP